MCYIYHIKSTTDKTKMKQIVNLQIFLTGMYGPVQSITYIVIAVASISLKKFIKFIFFT